LIRGVLARKIAANPINFDMKKLPSN